MLVDDTGFLKNIVLMSSSRKFSPESRMTQRLNTDLIVQIFFLLVDYCPYCVIWKQKIKITIMQRMKFEFMF